MNRRQVLSVIGIAGLGGGVLWFAYQSDQGNIDTGDESEVSAEVHDESESFEFEANAGDDIYISLRKQSEDDVSARFSLHGPDDAEVFTRSRTAGTDTDERHTADQSGTYRLTVDPQGGRFQVSVSVVEPEE